MFGTCYTCSGHFVGLDVKYSFTAFFKPVYSTANNNKGSWCWEKMNKKVTKLVFQLLCLKIQNILKLILFLYTGIRKSCSDNHLSTENAWTSTVAGTPRNAEEQGAGFRGFLLSHVIINNHPKISLFSQCLLPGASHANPACEAGSQMPQCASSLPQHQGNQPQLLNESRLGSRAKDVAVCQVKGKGTASSQRT